MQYETPDIELSIPSLSENLLPDKKLSVDITVSAKNGVPMHIFFFSENPRIRIRQSYAIGRSIKFTLIASTFGLQSGDKLKGSVDIIYNGGEKTLPYDFTIGMQEDNTAFDSLEAFHDFALRHPEEAVKIYDRREFVELPFMQSLKLQGLYQTFYETARPDYGFSEFMAAAGCPLYGFTEQKAESGERKKRSAAEHTEDTYSMYLRCLSLFLAYERFLRADLEKQTDFRAEFKNLSEKYPEDILPTLLYIYVLIHEDADALARKALIGIQDRVQKERTEYKDLYCFFLYLTCSVQKDETKKEQTVKLIHRYFTDNTPSNFLFYLEYRMNPEYSEPEKAYAFLRQYYYRMNYSPLIRQELVFLWRDHAPEVGLLTDLELSSLLFGIRNRLVTEKVLFSVLSNELTNPKLINLYILVLKAGYRYFHHPELLRAVINVFLQRQNVGRPYFRWYLRGAEETPDISGLFEYFLASLPTDFEETLPENVIRYFAAVQEPDQISRDILYRDVCLNYKTDPEVWAAYEKRIEAYAFRRVKDGDYTVMLAPVFETVILDKTPDEDNAAAMMEILSLSEIRTSRTDCRAVIIHYPELNKEASYSLENGKALAPVYTKKAVIALEGPKGERYFDPGLSVTARFQDADRYRTCSSLMKDTFMTELIEADRIISEGEMDEKDLFIVTSMIREKKTDAFFRARLYEALIDLSNQPAMSHIDCMQFLLEADFSKFSAVYKARFVDALITKEYYAAAYERILTYGFERVTPEKLETLVCHVMAQPIGDDETTILGICLYLFRTGCDRPEILRYLASYYDGKTADMTALIRALKKKKLPVEKLPERALVQAFYTAEDKYIDFLFELYASDIQRDDLLIKAYLCYRAHGYFLGKCRLTDTAAEELKKYVLMLPKVGMLALLSYYAAETVAFSEDDRALCELLVKRAADENLPLACYDKFRGKITLPAVLEGRVFVEYRDEKASEVTVIGTVLPERKYFHRSLTEVYPGVFVRSFILYKREWLKFYYSIHTKDGRILEEEGEIISQEADPERHGSRYEDVERLEKKAEKGDIRETAEFMRSLILKENMINDIFKDAPLT